MQTADDTMTRHGAERLCATIRSRWPLHNLSPAQAQAQLLTKRGFTRSVPAGRMIEPYVERQELGPNNIIFVVRSPEPVRYA